MVTPSRCPERTFVSQNIEASTFMHNISLIQLPRQSLGVSQHQLLQTIRLGGRKSVGRVSRNPANLHRDVEKLRQGQLQVRVGCGGEGFLWWLRAAFVRAARRAELESR